MSNRAFVLLIGLMILLLSKQAYCNTDNGFRIEEIADSLTIEYKLPQGFKSQWYENCLYIGGPFKVDSTKISIDVESLTVDSKITICWSDSSNYLTSLSYYKRHHATNLDKEKSRYPWIKSTITSKQKKVEIDRRNGIRFEYRSKDAYLQEFLIFKIFTTELTIMNHVGFTRDQSRLDSALFNDFIKTVHFLK
jgi:viroplasmin and RNaseH domain-containing protein